MKHHPATPVILIVDDDGITVRILASLLGAAGFKTLAAGDLAAAEATFRAQPVSLVLLDVHLPDGNGFELCRRLFAPSNVPVLFISANEDVDSKVQGFAAGGVDYITKPLAGAEVLARVRTHLRLRAAYESLAELDAERIGRLADSQQSIMPQPQALPEARFGVYVRQALSAGGDFYDVIASGNGIHDYVVADASGHDLGVSLWTASFKTLLAEYGSVMHSPQEIMRMINNSLRRILPEQVYFTAQYLRLNRLTKKAILVNAGHPPAIHISARGVPELLEQEGDLIGMFPDPQYGYLERSVGPGDRLVLYTDGLIEMDGPRDVGTSRLLEACARSVALPLDAMTAAVIKDLVGERDCDDDIILKVIEV